MGRTKQTPQHGRQTDEPSAASKITRHEPSREEVVANILHVLSSSTEISPLLCRCEWEDTDGGEVANIAWEPFVSLAESMPDLDSGVATHSNFLRNWLIDFLRDLRCYRQDNMGGMGSEDLTLIMGAFADTSRLDKLLTDNNNDLDEDLLWQAGLDLLQTHLFPGEEPDTNDCDNLVGDLSTDEIPPHELMRTVMDSYFCNDNDLDLGELSAIEVDTPSKQVKVFKLPSSIAMLFVRTLLVSRALESAEESTSGPSESSKPIRWRRLKSMVNDALSLYQRMLFDYAGKSVDNFEYGRHPKRLGVYPVEPDQITAITTWLYTNHVFPSCHDLLRVLLWNDEKNANGKGQSSRVKILETCYDSFRMLTSLLALDVAVVDKEYTSPPQCIQRAVERIESKSTSDFFDHVKSAQKEMPSKEISHGSGSDSEHEMYCPWKDGGPGSGGRGLSLEEDLLLYPSIRKKFEKSDKPSSATFYDELGIATFAYWKLMAQADSSSSALSPLPYPYSNPFRWTLLFPHVITFLSGLKASSSMERMDDLEYLSRFNDGYLVGINFTIFCKGFDMLQTLIAETPAIRPCCTRTQHLIVRWAQSSRSLESTIAVLLSHVVRISSLEASRGNKPTPRSYIPLKYTSLEVLNMTRTLLGFYPPQVQVCTLSAVCELIKTTPERVLLPTALDFMRAIIMEMCKNIQRYNDDGIASDDMGVMQHISEILDTFLLDVYDTFGDSLSPLPKDVDEFMASVEVFSSTFAAMRLQRIWISRCASAMDELAGNQEALFCYDNIVQWMDQCLGKLNFFESSLARLIEFWESSDDRPINWHRLFLMKLSLQDALNKPDKES